MYGVRLIKETNNVFFLEAKIELLDNGLIYERKVILQ
jgi:hypothetical protein